MFVERQIVARAHRDRNPRCLPHDVIALEPPLVEPVLQVFRTRGEGETPALAERANEAETELAEAALALPVGFGNRVESAVEAHDRSTLAVIADRHVPRLVVENDVNPVGENVDIEKF